MLIFEYIHGWWQDCRELDVEDYPLADRGANVNTKCSMDLEKTYDPLATAMTSQTLVEVEKWEAS